MIKKSLGLVLASVLTFSIVSPTESYANDISNHQMVTELTYWANKGVILPDAKGNYNPNRKVTRGEFASYIARALDLPLSTKYTFSDLKGASLTREVQNAAGAGILSGYPDGTFRPNDQITRQQMAGMLYNALKYLNVPLEEAPLTFKDNERIYYSFEKGVATSVHYNIIRGSHTDSGVYFNPKDSATIAHAAAFLFRMYHEAEKYNQPDEGNEQPPEEAVKQVYYVGKIENGTITKNPTMYQTYSEALAALDASSSLNLIYFGNNIIKAPSGLAYAADTSANTTSVYAYNNFVEQISYVTEGRELKYNGTGVNSKGEVYVIVQIGDVVGYAKPTDVSIIPTAAIENRDEYFITDGMLNHRIYNHVQGRSEGFYTVGPAADFMKSGETYYSFDGVHFFNKQMQEVGTYYPYFQFASVRKPSNYTAAELETMINKELELKQASGASKYANLTKESKLIGLGSYLKEMEEKYGVNALFILATAIHESDYGISAKAKDINNLFGIKVYDHDPLKTGEKYAEPKDSVFAFVNYLLNANYLPQNGDYRNEGAVPGNKTVGVNVNYASDPHWGSKVAGHMYRMDSRNGFKDYEDGQIGMVMASAGSVNTRVEPTTNSTIAYSYDQKRPGQSGEFGYPVVIADKTEAADGYVWYKVYSDATPPYTASSPQFVWIRSDLVNVLD
ncbi:glucosaminidase [Lysinibacillus sp. PLM2]|nr:glucosaminidase [Lysinibacillus sp. PLM2]